MFLGVGSSVFTLVGYDVEYGEDRFVAVGSGICSFVYFFFFLVLFLFLFLFLSFLFLQELTVLPTLWTDVRGLD